MRHKKDRRRRPTGRVLACLVAAVGSATVLVAQGVPAPGPEEVTATLVAQSVAGAQAGRPADDDPGTDVPTVSPTPAALLRVPKPRCFPRHDEVELTVVSYNMKSARSSRGFRLDQIAREIAGWGPDVVLLQEVDKNRHVTRNIDMPAWLGARLGMNHAFGANVSYGGGQYGTAVLSRYPILSTRNVHLPNRPGMQQRGLLNAQLLVDGVPLSVYDTHLQNRSQPMRMEQIRAINRILAADPIAKVLGGDFNSHPGSPVMVTARQMMRDTWESVGAGPGFTHPAVGPRGRIDYLLHAGTIEALSADVLMTGSDHRAVRATYRVVNDTGMVCARMQ